MKHTILMHLRCVKARWIMFKNKKRLIANKLWNEWRLHILRYSTSALTIQCRETVEHCCLNLIPSSQWSIYTSRTLASVHTHTCTQYIRTITRVYTLGSYAMQYWNMYQEMLFIFRYNKRHFFRKISKYTKLRKNIWFSLIIQMSWSLQINSEDCSLWGNLDYNLYKIIN